MSTVSTRFRDPMVRLRRFGDDILVCCPACSGRASIRPAPSADNPRAAGLHRRLTCSGCGHVAHWSAPQHGNGRSLPHLSGPEDPYFGLPLWLRTDFRGHVFWAYNADHLTLLEQYLTADLRERGSAFSCCDMSLLEQLPAWMKAAKHRGDLLRAVHRLRARLS
ncbi:hypothetical protein [Actinoplanes rectilineatus]|uniref:hypothetical protein n=1 Tax=Actinoplanes rectilineatus TaxID=113571 RepID=UPI0005F2E2DF|nr:hypothetical protein [Actinoplanes rectilineatus]